METKEKKRGEAAPRKRPAAKAAPAGGKTARTSAPRRQPAKRSADPPVSRESDEVFIPAAESREEHNRPQNRSGKSAAPRGRAPARKSTPAKKGKKPTEEQYQPYRKANAAQKQLRTRNFTLQVRRFFSSENPVVKLFHREDPAVFGEKAPADPNEARKAKRAAEKEKRRRQAQRWNMPATMYIQPAAFNSRRLAVQLLTVLAVVMAFVLGMSVFFRVKTITVSGANVYSAWTIREKSGISVGDNLLTFGRTKASGQIIANLPYVKSARIGIKLPDTVNIEIEEEAVVYSIQDQDGVWWLMNSDGKVVEQTSSTNAKSYTQVLGVTLSEPHASEAGVAKEDVPATTAAADGSDPTATTAYTPTLVTAAQRLNAALKILQALEDNDIVGDAASVDVSQLQDIILWYGTQYQVNLGSIDRIDYKIAYMKNAILQMSEYQTGILDVSFTTWPDCAGFTPFD